MSSNALLRSMELVRDLLRLFENLAAEVAYLEKEHSVQVNQLGNIFKGIDQQTAIQQLNALEPTAKLAFIEMLAEIGAITSSLNTVFTSSPHDKIAWAERIEKIAKKIENAIGTGKVFTRPTDMDEELIERCTNKDYHDTVSNAFTILEDRIRNKITSTAFGSDLMEEAFNRHW